MNPEQYDRVCHLFEECTALLPEAREAFLARRCREDSAIRTEVMRMLEFHDSPMLNLPDDTPGNATHESVKPTIPGYVVDQVLGVGGMGTVWRATHLSTSRLVALKIVDSVRLNSSIARARFEREVQLCARLQDPNIARLFDCGATDTFGYYSMELVQGVPIDQYAAEHEIPPRARVELIAQVCRAMEHAHQRGVIHRDLKPSNILVTEDGSPKIVDFGLAKRVLEEESDGNVSIAGEILGTPNFMSPEQASGQAGLVDTRSDVYSLGVILFRLVTGDAPHDETGSVASILRRKVTEEVRSPRQLAPTIDRDLEAILLKALAKEQDERYRSAGDFGADLQRVLTGQPVGARHLSVTYVISKVLRQNQLAAATISFITLGLLAIAIAFFVVTKMHERTATRLADLAAQEQKRAESLSYALGIRLAAEEIENYNFQSARTLLASLPEAERDWEWRYLSRKVNLTDKSSWKHSLSDRISVVKFSPDNQLVAVAMSRSTIEATTNPLISLFDANSGALVRQLEGHSDGVHGLSFTPDGKQIVSGGRDNTLCRWSVDDGRLLERVSPESVDSDGNRVPFFFFDIVFDNNRKLVAFSANPSGLMVTRLQGDWENWSLKELLKNAQNVVQLPGERGTIALDERHGTILWSTLTWIENQGHLFAVDMDTLEVKRHLKQIPGNPFTSLDVSPTREHILTSSFDGRAQVRDAETFELVHEVRGHLGAVNSAVFLGDGSQIATIGSDQLIRIWDLVLGRTTKVFSPSSESIGGRMSVDNRRDAVVVIQRSELSMWPLDQVFGDSNVIVKHNGKVRHTVVSPNQNHVASAGEDGQVNVFDVETRTTLWNGNAGRRYGTAVAFSNDGKILAVGSSENPNTASPPIGEIRLFDAAHGALLSYPIAVKKWVWDIRFSDDNRMLAVGMGVPGDAEGKREAEAVVIDLATRKTFFRAVALGARCRSLAFGPDGKSLVTASELELATWDLGTGKKLHSDVCKEGRNFVRFQDGMAVTGNESSIEFRTYPELELTKVFKQARYSNDRLGLSNVADVSFTTDGRRMASAAWNGTLTIWDRQSGQSLWTFSAHDNGAHHVQFCRNNSAIVSSGHDGTVKLW